MKNLIITILVAFVAMAPFKESNAHNSPRVQNYSIPAYNVPVSQNTIFQEINHFATDNNTSRERRTAHCDVDTSTPPSSPNAIIAVVQFFSLDGQDVYGPYNVYEDETLDVDIDDRQWGVTILEVMNESEMSVWIGN